MSKQLAIGALFGALCTGLVFVLFSGESIEVKSDDGLALLAQVIPNEPSVTLDEEEVTSEDIIEIREAPARAPAPKNEPSEAAEDVVDDADLVEDSDIETILTYCAYESDDELEQKGIISEVAWMGIGEDPNAEWIEIQNRTKADLDVSGWQLIDKSQQIQVMVPAGVILERSGFLIFERDKDRLQGESILYKGALGNTDEGLRLFDVNCDLQDEVIAKSKWSAGTNKPKYTAERAKDLSWHTFYGDDDAGVFGTPGKKNSSGPPPEPEPEPEPEVASEPLEEPEPESEPEPVASSSEPVVEPEPEPVVITSGQLIIGEVMAGSASSAGDEFIELYNTTESEIDLTGFSIKKKVLSSGSESSLVTTVNFEGKKVASGQRFIIGHGSFVAQTQMSWPTSYSIAYGGNAVLLYNTQGGKIDEVSWELSAGQSYMCVSQGSCAVQEIPNPGE